MSIKFRLLISYLAMLIIPVALTTLAVVVIGYIYLGDLREFYHSDIKYYSVEQIISEGAETFEDVKLTASTNPDKLSDPQYLGDLEKKLEVINTGIIVRKDNSIVFISDTLNRPEIEKRLSKPNDFHNDHDPILIGHNLLSLKQFDFTFSDGSPGSLFMVSDVSPLGKITEDFLGALFLAIILILVLTNGLLTYFVSRSILKPIEALENAAGQIKEGNLNFEVSSASNDEIGQLCRTFEAMRCKLKESIEKQLQYEENRKELIANISHDLKTPITAIKGYTEGILDGVPNSPEKMEKYIQTIHSKAIAIDKLIDELFLFSKLDLKRETFNFEHVEIISFLQYITDELGFDLNKNGIRLNWEGAHKQPVIVIADREKLKRVINNIIDNSSKYMDKTPGIIKIFLKDHVDFITVGISDNGKGISREALTQIFDRFYRADRSRNGDIPGSGLGLAIAGRIIEEHGGTIWADSEEGLGTTIYFTLKKGNRVE
jgi:Signal transduction histidine kinase